MPPAQNTAELSRGQFVVMVAALTASQLISTVTALLPPAIAPAVAAGHGLPVFMIGYQSSLVFIGMLVSLTLGSNAIPRWGGCRSIQAGAVLMALGAVMASSGSVALLVIASLAIGIGYGFITPANSRILRRFTPGRIRNVVFSIAQTGVPLGVLVAATAGPALTVSYGWEWALWASAGLCCALGLVLQAGRERLDDDRNAAVSLRVNPLKPVRVMWAIPGLRLLALAGATLGAAQVIIHSYTVAMVYEQLGMPLVQAGLMLTMAQIGGVLGRLFWGWLADRSRDCLRVLIVLSGFMALISLVVATLDDGWTLVWTYLLFFAFGTTASGWHGAYLAEVARLSPPDQVTTATNGVLAIIQTSAVLVPVVFASVFLLVRSYSLSFGMLAIPAIASIFLLRAARSASAR